MLNHHLDLLYHVCITIECRKELESAIQAVKAVLDANESTPCAVRELGKRMSTTCGPAKASLAHLKEAIAEAQNAGVE